MELTFERLKKLVPGDRCLEMQAYTGQQMYWYVKTTPVSTIDEHSGDDAISFDCVAEHDQREFKYYVTKIGYMYMDHVHLVGWEEPRYIFGAKHDE